MFGRDATAVTHDLGAVLCVPAAMAAITVPVAWFAGDRHLVIALVGVAALTGAVGLGLVRASRHARAKHAWPALQVVALGWLAGALVSSVVFVLFGLLAPEGSADIVFADPLNALFEGMSSMTSTGLTMVGGQEDALSATAQWWRSLGQWVGGVGMAVFALGLAHSATGMRNLYEAEGRHPDLPGGMTGTVRGTAGIYLGLTVLAIAALAATEHNLWAAVNHGLTTISTGGFTITGDGLAGYGRFTQSVVMVLMTIGALSFVVLHVLLVQRRPGRARHLTPLRAQLAVLTGGAVVFVAVHAVTGSDVPVFDRVFQWASASGTAGHSSDVDVQVGGVAPLLLLAGAMFVGASSGSTGGGWKLDRLVWLIKAVRRRLLGETGLTWDGGPVNRGHAETLVRHAAILGVLWLATAALTTLVLVASTDAPHQLAMFDAVSALGNVGLSAGVTDADLGGPAKGVLVAVMYLGRLELLSALVLATQVEHA